VHQIPPDSAAMVDTLDEYIRAIYLQVPSAQVVLFQAFFELFEGVGIIRTLSIRKSLICILTTRDCLDECFRILNALSSQLQWRQVERPEEATQQLYLGYFGKN
jgi:hypothetical protein